MVWKESLWTDSTTPPSNTQFCSSSLKSCVRAASCKNGTLTTPASICHHVKKYTQNATSKTLSNIRHLYYSISIFSLFGMTHFSIHNAKGLTKSLSANIVSLYNYSFDKLFFLHVKKWHVSASESFLIMSGGCLSIAYCKHLLFLNRCGFEEHPMPWW